MDGKIKVRLSKPFLNLEKVTAYFSDILESGYFVQGKYVKALENSLAEYLKVNHCLAVSSGTAALHLALAALEVKPGDEVIVPAFTFPATVNVIELLRAKPVLVDVDLETYNIDVGQIEEKITDKTKAIMVVHLFGNPVNMDEILAIAKKYNLRVIEDAAGALGSLYKEQKCGVIGDIGCFSFHPRKVVTTAEGGAVVTNDFELARKVEVLRNHGMVLEANKRDFILAGFNYRMNEFEAALGLAQCEDVEDIDKNVQERIELVRKYCERLKEIDSIKFQKEEGNVHSYQALVVRLEGWNNLEVIEKLSRLGVETTVGAYAVHMLTYYSKKYGYKPEDYPNAKVLHEESIALPLYNGMREEEVEYVVESIRRALDENRA